MSILQLDRPLLFIKVYVLLFFVLIGIAEGSILVAGSNIMQVIPPALASYWLIHSYLKGKGTIWLYFGIGMISYLMGMVLWGFIEIILGKINPFPGIPDLFWSLAYLFFFLGILKKVSKRKSSFYTVQFLFDLFLVMITAGMYSYKLIMEPILTENQQASLLFEIVYIGYPIGDLGILLGAAALYLSSNRYMEKKSFNLLIWGLFTYFAADTIYVYLVTKGLYATGNFLDPLFSLSLMLIGAASIYSGTEAGTIPERRAERRVNIRLLVPYISSTLFMLLMVFYHHDHTVVYTAIFVSVIIILRFVFVILENRRLVVELESANSFLEEKIKERTKDLEESRQRYQSLFEHHPDFVYSIDLDGRIVTVNQAFRKRAADISGEVIGQSFLPLLEEGDREFASEKFHSAKQGIPQEYEVTTIDGQILQITNIPMVIAQQVIGVYGIGRNITRQKRAVEKIDFLANHDSLTGLPNRRMFEKALMQAINEYEAQPFYVMLIDLDGFKEINDQYGHDIGDLYLQEAARRLKSSIREKDVAARLGGDEFILLVKDVEPPIVEAIGKRILESIRSIEMDGFVFNISCSIGLSSYPQDGAELSELMKMADLAMYRVKQNGKNDVSFYTA